MSEEWIEQPLSISADQTEPCMAFLFEYYANCSFVWQLLTVREAYNGFVSASKSEPEIAAGEQGSGGPITALMPLISEMVWCRAVDNFLTYIAQLMGLVFRERPETMRSARNERLDVILGFDDMMSLVDHLAEKRVHELAYGGLNALNDTLDKEIGLRLFNEGERLERAILLVETRNLIVHNRGIINSVFIKKTGATWAKVGMKDQVGLLCGVRCQRFLATAAMDIDARAIAKFGLPSKSLNMKSLKAIADMDVECMSSTAEHVKAQLDGIIARRNNSD